MKNLLFLTILLLFAFTANSQNITYVVKDTVEFIDSPNAYVGYHLSSAMRANSDFDTEFQLIRDSLIYAVNSDLGLYTILDELNKTHVVAINYVVVITKEYMLPRSRKDFREHQQMLKALSKDSYKPVRYHRYGLAKVVRKAIKKGRIEQYVRNLVNEIRADNVEGYGEWRYHLKQQNTYKQ